MKKSVFIFCVLSLLAACRSERGTVVKMETNMGTIRLRLYDETPAHRENFIKLARRGYYDGMLFHRVIRDFMIQAGDPVSREAKPGEKLGEGDIGYVLKPEILPRYFHQRGALAAAREGDEVNPGRLSSGSHFYVVQGKKYTPQELETAVERINARRYKAIADRLRAERNAEIEDARQKQDERQTERINREIADSAKIRFERVRLVLTEEQREAYTTLGGTPHLDGEYTVFGEVIEGLDILERICNVETDENDRPVKDVVILKLR